MHMGKRADSLLLRATKNKSRQQLQDEFDRLKARVGIGGGATSANVSIETTRENLAGVLTLVAEVLRQPSFPASEFDQLKQELTEKEVLGQREKYYMDLSRTDALTGLKFSSDAHVDVLAAQKGALVVWRGIREGKRARVAQWIGESVAPSGAPFAIGSSACVATDTLFTIGGTGSQ